MPNKNGNYKGSRQFHQHHNNNGNNNKNDYNKKNPNDNAKNSLKECNQYSIKNYYYKNDFLNQLRKKCTINSFKLVTTYPGLLVGSGYLCTTEIEELKIGFLFDYVSGCPYIPGSEIKGMIRSYFPKSDDDSKLSDEDLKLNYIKSVISDNSGVKNPSLGLIYEIEKSIFENNDCFIGAYPITEGNILDFDYITPHIQSMNLENNDIYKDPSPLKMIKVKPGVSFEFCFILSDSSIVYNEEKYTLNVDEKLNIFKQIILDMGVGAKTSVGFSRFAINNNQSVKPKNVPNKFFNMNYVFYNDQSKKQMKSYKITFSVNNLSIPLNYHHQLQSLFFNMFKNGGATGFHDKEDSQNNFKFFTFSCLRGGNITDDKKKLLFESEMNVVLRIADEKLIQAFEKAVYTPLNFFDQQISIKAYRVDFIRFSSSKYKIRTLSPIELHITDESGKTTSVSPFDDNFKKLIKENFKRKYASYYNSEPLSDIDIEIADNSKIKKYVTLYKKENNIYVTAYSGDFIISGDAEYIKFLYYCGLGSRNSSGFGLFDIIKEIK